MLFDWTISVPLRTAYLVEQICLIVVTALLLSLFIWQTEIERRAKLDMNNIKVKFHRLGLISCLIFAALAVDPYGIHGYYSPNVTPWLLGNNAAILLGCVLFLNQIFLEVECRARLQSVPAWINIVTWTLFLGTLAFCNIIFLVAHLKEIWWITSFFDIWMTLVILGFVITYITVVCRLRSLLERSEREDSISSRESKTTSRSNAWKWRVAFFVIFAIITSSLYILLAVRDFPKTDRKMFTVNLDAFDPYEHLLLYTEVVALVFVLAYSWIPRKQYQPVSVEDDQEAEPTKSVSWKVSTRQRLQEDGDPDDPASPRASSLDKPNLEHTEDNHVD